MYPYEKKINPKKNNSILEELNYNNCCTLQAFLELLKKMRREGRKEGKG
jgi:hypothetical protein